MTKDDIAKLPTPKTDHAAWRSQFGDHVPTVFARSLEQRLAAAVMALERLCKIDELKRQHGRASLVEIDAAKNLAAIRGDK